MYSRNRQTEQYPWSAIAGVTVAALTAGLIFHKTLVANYGWEGAIRFVWEGEPFPPRIRDMLDSLSEVEKSRATQEERMSAIEEALDRARLDSVDDVRTSKTIVLRWTANYGPRNLEKSLAELSATLDKLAAQVDAVVLSSSETNSNVRVVQDIKRRKKLLSKQLVLDMERCDAFMSCYQVLNE